MLGAIKSVLDGSGVPLLLALAGLLLWGGEVNGDLKGISGDVSALSVRVDRLEAGTSSVQRELAGLAAQLDAVRAQQDRIYGILTKGDR